MSQAKVDKYKKDKKNRKKIIRKQKIKTALAIFAAAIVLGALMGVPLGKTLYNRNKKAEEEKKAEAEVYDKSYIDIDSYNDWFDNYYTTNYYDLYAGMTLATGGDSAQ